MSKPNRMSGLVCFLMWRDVDRAIDAKMCDQVRDVARVCVTAPLSTHVYFAVVAPVLN